MGSLSDVSFPVTYLAGKCCITHYSTIDTNQGDETAGYLSLTESRILRPTVITTVARGVFYVADKMVFPV